MQALTDSKGKGVTHDFFIDFESKYNTTRHKQHNRAESSYASFCAWMVLSPFPSSLLLLLLLLCSPSFRFGSLCSHSFLSGAAPTPAEQEIFDRVQAVLGRSDSVLEALRNYSGTGDSIRNAISNPKDEGMQTVAWDTVSPLVAQLKSHFDYSAEVEGVLPVLLGGLCGEGNPEESLATKQALAKQCAELLSFVLKFDDLKMNNPNIQNDFSYYRRTLSRMKMKDPNADETAVVNNEQANRMSLFYAYPTPMLKVVSEATTKFVSENKDIPIGNTTDTLAIMASVCRIMIEQPAYHDRFTNPSETLTFCQRVMVACVIVYDHVHMVGAFSKKNKAIDMARTIKAVIMHENPNTNNLLNALRFSTKHLNDDDTSKSVKSLLA